MNNNIKRSHGIDNDKVPKSKSRRARSGPIALIACKRCKSRKQKCDGDFESATPCSNCRNSKKECHYESNKGPHYVKYLELKTANLEEKLNDMTHRDIETSDTKTTKSTPISRAGTDPLFPGDNGEFNISQMLLCNPMKELRTHDALLNNEIDWSECLANLVKQDELIDRYFDIYVEYIHSKFPMLDHKDIQYLKSNKTNILSGTNEESTPDKFICLMICAVGARIVSERESNENLSNNIDAPENHTVFYINGLCLNLRHVFSFRELKHINALLLLVIYLLRTPNGVVIWDLIRFAMGVCIDFGLHRRNIKRFEEDPIHYQLRARTFWTAYSLERVISNSFGRPYSISDIDIDIDLPVDAEDSADPDFIRSLFYTKHPELNYSKFDTSLFEMTKERTYLTMSINFFKLRKIDSEIQSSIYRVDNKNDDNDIPFERIAELQNKMKQWIKGLPESLSTFEFDYCLYLFNKQICSLTQPFITKLDSKDALFTETIRSCLDICLLSRKIHQSSSYQQSFISLQTAFLAGVTISYGLLSSKVGWGFEVSEGLRNCSSVLYLFAERSSSASKFRDIFEALVFEVDQMRYSHEQRELPKNNNSFQTSDLFGKGELKKRFQEFHKKKNLELFEKISNTQTENVNSPLNQMFELENLDSLFENIWKIDDILAEGQVLDHF
jgi:hypothetical protein